MIASVHEKRPDTNQVGLLSCEDEFIECSGVYYGCNDESACNYEEGNNVDAQGCDYAEDNFDCDGNCLLMVDCFGECGGTAQDFGCGCGEDAPSGCDNACGSELEFDECGVCGGDGSEPGFDDGNALGYANLSFGNATDSSVEVLYSSDNAIGGFQINVEGVTLTGVSSDTLTGCHFLIP